MAVLSSAGRNLGLPNSDPRLSPPADPFWQTSPRTTPATLASLMAAVHQAAPTAPKPDFKPAKQAQAVTSRRPQCTHTNMTRQHGTAFCSVCGKVPKVGWLYACQQDRELARLRPFTHPEVFDVPNDDISRFAVQSRLAASYGMRVDMVQAIRDGEYSYQQADKLIRQKQHLYVTIRNTMMPLDGTPSLHGQPGKGDDVISSVGATATPPASAGSSSALPMTPTTARADSMVNKPIKKHSALEKQTCNFQVCHSCRPFFQDRLYMSIESVLSGRMPAVTEEEITELPLLNPSIVRNLGLRQPRLPQLPTMQMQESMDVTVHQGDGYEDDTSDWTPTSATVSESDSDPYPCPGSGNCPLWSRYSGCAYDSGFDDGLRALNHGFGPEPPLFRMTPENSYSRLRYLQTSSAPETPGGASSTASSISLPTPDTVPLTPLLPTDESFDTAFDRRLVKARKAASVCPILSGQKSRKGRLGLGASGNNSNSSLGSEVEVEGGVALTEEAVGTGRPDIVTGSDS